MNHRRIVSHKEILEAVCHDDSKIDPIYLKGNFGKLYSQTGVGLSDRWSSVRELKQFIKGDIIYEGKG